MSANAKNDFQLLQIIKINDQNYRLGIITDNHGAFGKYRQIAVLDKYGKNCFPDTESTWSHNIDGYYIGNLLPGDEPEIIVWTRTSVCSSVNKSKMCGKFYRYCKSAQKYVIYWKNVTDDEFTLNQKKEITKSLLGNTQFIKYYHIMLDFLKACRKEDWQAIKKYTLDQNSYQVVKDNFNFFRSLTPNIWSLKSYHNYSVQYDLTTPYKYIEIKYIPAKKKFYITDSRA